MTNGFAVHAAGIAFFCFPGTFAREMRVEALYTFVLVATIGGCMSPELTVSALSWLLFLAVVFLPSDSQVVDKAMLVEQFIECNVVLLEEDQEDWIVFCFGDHRDFCCWDFSFFEPFQDDLLVHSTCDEEFLLTSGC